MNEQITTDKLDHILKNARPQFADEYLSKYSDVFAPEEHPFAQYMRTLIREKGMKQQDVFIAADIPERYGYKLISEEKHTINRDYIVRLCLGARFTLKETQRALKLYGMSPLYPKIPRDAVLIIVFNYGLLEVAEADSLLESHGMESLSACKEKT